jgi:hypothetical protein
MQQVTGAISEWLGFNEYDIDTGWYMAPQWRERGEEYCKHSRIAAIAVDACQRSLRQSRTENRIAPNCARCSIRRSSGAIRPWPTDAAADAPATYINRPSKAEAVQPQAAKRT